MDLLASLEHKKMARRRSQSTVVLMESICKCVSYLAGQSIK